MSVESRSVLFGLLIAVSFLIIAVLFPSNFSKSSIVSGPGSVVSVVYATAKLLPFVYPTAKGNAVPTKKNNIPTLVLFIIINSK